MRGRGKEREEEMEERKDGGREEEGREQRWRHQGLLDRCCSASPN